MKLMELFEVTNAVDEIVTLLQDKIDLKKIEVITKFLDFPNEDTVIKSD